MSVRISFSRHLVATLAFIALVGLAVPATASASHPLVTALDPEGPYAGADATLVSQRTRDAGAGAIRLLLNWKEVAPSSPPPGFDPSNPADPAYNWSTFEGEVKPAAAAGLQVLVVIRSAPAWAEGSGSGRSGTVRPDPVQFARFAHAAAVRYGGSFQGLPRIRYWQMWNEPNHFGFLNPQLENGQLVGPDTYRLLVNAFADAVHAVHPDNMVIAGGLAPFHNDGAGQIVTAPLAFMRSLLCMSGGSHPKPTCNTRVKFDIWSHHPYTSGSPTHHAAAAGDVSIPELPRMRTLLRAAIRAGHVVSSYKVRFWVTEFSWDTNPPDPGGVPLALHARWVSEALFRMWKAGVSLVTWFKLRDDAANGRPHSDSFESGLYFRCQTLSCDRPKPALQAFRFPFVAFRNGRRVYFWGRTPSGKRGRVIVEQAVGKRWKRLAQMRTDRYGIFSRRVRTSRKGRLRARLAGGGTQARPFSLRRPPDLPVNPFG
jgi:hypothetical protein